MLMKQVLAAPWVEIKFWEGSTPLAPVGVVTVIIFLVAESSGVNVTLSFSGSTSLLAEFDHLN